MLLNLLLALLAGSVVASSVSYTAVTGLLGVNFIRGVIAPRY